MKKLKVKLIKENASLPRYATGGSAAFDLTAVWAVESSGNWIYGTGLAVEIPEGHVGLLFPRSSVCKTNLLLSNCVGVIDADYRGEIVLVYRQGEWPGQRYDEGDRIGQLMIVELPAIEIEEVRELSQTLRGDGGFGSTGL